MEQVEHHHQITHDPVVKNFTSVQECIDYIVPLVKCKEYIITHLNSLTTDKGIVVTNMPIYKYQLDYDIEYRDRVTLNALEFRDGADYPFVTVSKLFGWVTSQHNGLGNLVSIDLTTTLYPCRDKYHDERIGEHEPRAFWM